MSLDEYLAIRALSSGAITDYLTGATDVWHRRYELGIRDDERSNEGDVGTCVHSLLLEGIDVRAVWRGGMTKGRVLKDGTIAKDSQKPTTSKNSEAYAEFVAANPGRVVLDQDDDEIVDGMCEAVLAHRDAAELLAAAGASEFTMQWDELGMAAKARADRRLDAGIIVELKTTFADNFTAVVKQAHDTGYQHRDEWYRRAYLGTHGEHAREFVFISVSKTPPHPVWVWRWDEFARDVARREVDHALAGILGRRATDDWQQDESKMIVEATIPIYRVHPVIRAQMESER